MTGQARKHPKINPITLEFNQQDLLTNKRAFKGPNGELIVECNRCLRKLSPHAFHRSKAESLGLRSICKECAKEKNRLDIRDRLNTKPYRDHERISNLDHHNMRELKRAIERNITALRSEPLNIGDPVFEIKLELNPELSGIQVFLEGKEKCNITTLDSSSDFAISVLTQLKLFKIRLADTSYQYEAE